MQLKDIFILLWISWKNHAQESFFKSLEKNNYLGGKAKYRCYNVSLHLWQLQE